MINTEKKILGHAELIKTLRRLRARGEKIVFTNGCFDVLHLGHVKYLQMARALGDVLVIGLNSDASVRRIKGPKRPLNIQYDRARVLAALSAVDYVTVFGQSTPEKLIKIIRPDVLVKGADWQKSAIAGADFVISHGGRVVLAPLVKGRSTTSLIGKMQHTCAGTAERERGQRIR